MVLVFILLKTDINTRENLKKELARAKVNSLFKMVPGMMVNLKLDFIMVKANINSKIANIMKDLGLKTKEQEKENTYLKMEMSTKEILKTENEMAMVFLPFKTDLNMMDNL